MYTHTHILIIYTIAVQRTTLYFFFACCTNMVFCFGRIFFKEIIFELHDSSFVSDMGSTLFVSREWQANFRKQD